MRLIQEPHIGATLDCLHENSFVSQFSDVTLVFQDNQQHPYYKSLLSVLHPHFKELLQLFPHTDVIFLTNSGTSKFLDDVFKTQTKDGPKSKEDESDEREIKTNQDNFFTSKIGEKEVVDTAVDKSIKEEIGESKMKINPNALPTLKAVGKESVDSAVDSEDAMAQISEFCVPELLKTIKPRYPVPQKVLDKKQARINALTCVDCGHIATDFPRLEKHIKKVHTDGGTIFPCDQCTHKSRSDGKLRLHIRTMHENRKPIVCTICQFVADTPSKLELHIRKKHIEMYTGEQFLCDQCDFKAWTNAKIGHHKKSVHEGLRFNCEECDLSYATRIGLYTHSYKHKGILYPCPSCDYKASTSTNLKVHTVGKHDKIRFQCDLCSWTGSQKGMMKVHKKMKHSNLN